jgi:hypothetical protein
MILKPVFHNLRVSGKSAAGKKIVADEFYSVQLAATEKGSCDSRLVFSLDETRLFWKQMPS